MEEKKQHFRHIMLDYFKKGKNATETQKKICAVYGEDAVTERTCQKWFAKFRAGDFSLDDAPRSGRPVEVDSDQIETLIESNRRYTTREIADILKISKSSVENHLHQLGYMNRFDVWVPHKLSEKNLLDRISACDSLLKRNENVPFLKQIVMGNEKWILYNNGERKRSWSKRNEPPPTTPKAGLHPKKVMLCIWWDWKGVLYYELLPENQTINSNKYCSQLDQLKAALDEKRPELVNRKRIIFHQDTTRPHVSLMTRQKLSQLGWEVLIPPPYSPDIAPSDFHLFRSLQNSLNGRNFNSLEECKRHLEQFFAQKDKKFWEDGIMKLPEKWQKVVEQKGEYVVQ
ncbi:nucleotide triphosphate diphosphatase NUDT15 isoform X1 [Phocoena sinus]|uniref:Nudix hydrolase 15 n=1 Tax=Phocoena sinus TaxID=42100 RepID=A0A8C9C410_PHOSS|nr:nucleotide triphosphate diphosphatase NUDT15 isoform X1 [Phocoena sinus]XP_032467125.1 nucleotide triphosphate diphosphatase NUDT15 isoform X1 [Phocoena sinus]